MWVWTAIAIGIEPAPQRPSSSMKSEAGGEVAVGTAPRGGVVEPEKPELAAPAEDGVGEVARRLPLVDVRPELGVHESPHRIAAARRVRG